MPTALLLLAPLLLGGVAVEGRGACPAAAAVARHLEALVPEARGTVRLVPSEDGLIIELDDEAGRPLGRKALRSDRPCEELAQASALFVATWLRRPHAALSGPQLPAGPPPPSTPVGWGVGVAVVGAGDSAGLAPGALLQADLWIGTWAVELGAAGLWRRELELGPGVVGYRSLALRLGLGHGWPLGGWVVSGHGAVAGALFFLDGRGFDTELRATALAPGLALGVRLERPFGRLVPWIGLEGTVWLGEVRAGVEGLAERRSLPGWDTSLALGVSWGERPTRATGEAR